MSVLHAFESPASAGAFVPALLQDLMFGGPREWDSRPALTLAPGGVTLSRAELAEQVEQTRGALAGLGLARGARVAIYLEKRLETVVMSLAAPAAAGVMVPLNPVLKPDQVGHVLQDARPTVWLTSASRLAACLPALRALLGLESSLASLRQVVLVDGPAPPEAQAALPGVEFRGWQAFLQGPPAPSPRGVDSDLAAILYTSGSTGSPKGVMLSHRNLVVGARSVVQYLGNSPQDSLLAVLPLSFDAGFSQITTALTSGARVVLLNHLMPQDVLKALRAERITGLTAVPPLYHQLAALEWPPGVDEHLRYFASTGGPMPAGTLAALRARVPRSSPFVMYGLTEAFRSTVLMPDELDRKPGSMGRAIPNVEVLVLRPDGSECAADEPGELVHRGPLVGLGYWGDAERTAQRFRPLPDGVAGRQAAQVLPEVAVYSGDRVRRDAQGFLYHLGRLDEMIKTSGYRVSPSEVEMVLMGSALVGECVVFGVPDEALGQQVAAVVNRSPAAREMEESAWLAALRAHCRKALPAHMVPHRWLAGPAALPRNPNGKIDRVAVTAMGREAV